MSDIKEKKIWLQNDSKLASKKSPHYRFGLCLGAALCLLGTYCISIKQPLVGLALNGCGASVLLLSFSKADALAPAFVIWMWFSDKIGQFSTFITLLLVFYLLITPVALVFRAFKRDELNLSTHGNGRSTFSDYEESFDLKHQF